jgi:hypothetical protein
MNDIFHGPEDASSGPAGTTCLGRSYCGGIANTCPGTILFTSDSVLGGIPGGLDDNEALTLLFGYPGLYGTETTADPRVAVSSATRLRATDHGDFPFFTHLPENSYSDWII